MLYSLSSFPRLLIALLALLLIFWLFIISRLYSASTAELLEDVNEIDRLREELGRLKLLMEYEKEHLKGIQNSLKDHEYEENQILSKLKHPKSLANHRTWNDPIPILVFACNRANAVKKHLSKLLQYRPSKQKFPIIVSQDCDSEDVKNVVNFFGDKVQYVKHLAGDKANITVPPEHRMYVAYYRIARHYKLALEHVFDELGHTSVVITEDDLDIAPDFFEYFSATRYLLAEDPRLWCVSAWNDNGKTNNIDPTANGRLYRSDFFSGLGWMMTSALWKEFSPIWPKGFWDDWLRDPLRRKGRQCVRPEISRTGMMPDGQKGASKGQFFSKHLAKIVVNNNPFKFTQINLDYLLEKNYLPWFKKELESSPLMNIDEVVALTLKKDGARKNNSVRVEYTGNLDYIQKADKLSIMHDFKAGVPRTAYEGVVTCYINGIRIYLVPHPSVKWYNPKWEVPPSYGD